MDGLFNLVGTRTIPLKAHGKEYELTVRTLADYAKKEQAITARNGNPYAGLDAIEDDQKRAQAIRIVADVAARPTIATLTDEQRFDNSLRGIAYNLWRCLGVKHPDEFPPTVPIETGVQLGMDFIEWFGTNRIQELVEALFQTQEEDLLGNSDGQTATQ